MNLVIYPSSLILPNILDTLLIALLIMKCYININSKEARRLSKYLITISRNNDSLGLLPKTLEFTKQKNEESAPPS